MSEVLQKKCNRCEQLLPVDNFSRRSQMKDGINNICKVCDRARGRAYYQANKEKVRNKHKQYNLENKESNSERAKWYYQDNKERILKACKEYRDKEHDAVIQRARVKRARLDDGYVQRLLTVQYGLRNAPKEMLEAKRNIILLNRSLQNVRGNHS